MIAECDLVFSAHAEVVPIFLLSLGRMGSILRARGGSSLAAGHSESAGLYSLRTRR